MPEDIHDACEKQHQIPVVQSLCCEDAEQVAFVMELLEHGRCGASHGIFEIYSITKVGCRHKTVDDDEVPATNLLVDMALFPVKGKEYEYKERYVRDQDS